MDIVQAAASVNQVGPAKAVDRVANTRAEQRVGIVGPVDDARIGRRGEDEVGLRQIGERNALQRRRVDHAIEEEAPHRIAVEVFREIGLKLGEAGEPGLAHVELVDARHEVGNDVLPLADLEHVRVSAAGQHVVAFLAVERVFARAAVERVIAFTGAHRVVAAVAGEHVDAVRAVQRIVARAATDVIGSRVIVGAERIANRWIEVADRAEKQNILAIGPVDEVQAGKCDRAAASGNRHDQKVGPGATPERGKPTELERVGQHIQLLARLRGKLQRLDVRYHR